MLEFGVDEITLVLQLPQFIQSKIPLQDWHKNALNIIETFEEQSNFKTIFGERNEEERPPSGYTIAFTYGEHSFYLAVALHEMQPRMGIIVKFSAQSLDYYCFESGFNVYQFLQMIQCQDYTTRLSRIDLTVDYINENISVTNIYQNFIDNRIDIFREVISESASDVSYRKTNMKYEGYIKGQEVPTLYIGSVKSDSRLRVYDKKREQIERSGTKLDKAKERNDWTRFEGVFRNKYAHQLSTCLLKITTDIEFANLIACTMLQKFRIMYAEEGIANRDTEYSQMISDSITNKSIILKSPSNRNYELVKSIRHLFYGSGVITTFYKIREIWGDDELSKFFNYITLYLEEYEPNDDCRSWLTKNTNDYQKSFADFDSFSEKIIPIATNKEIDELLQSDTDYLLKEKRSVNSLAKTM